MMLFTYCLSLLGVSAESKTRREQRSQVAAVTYKLYKEKHVLRQMRGRRLDDHGPATFHSTSDPEHPVVVDAGWQQPSTGETEKHSLVRHLQVVWGILSLLCVTLWFVCHFVYGGYLVYCV